MKAFLTASATLVAAMTFSALFAPEASAGSVCRRDVTGFVKGCGYETMAQCQATRFGLGGDCFPDPLKYSSWAAAQNALAYDPGAGAFASADYPGAADVYASAGPVYYPPHHGHVRQLGGMRAMALYEPRPHARRAGRAMAYYEPRRHAYRAGRAMAYEPRRHRGGRARAFAYEARPRHHGYAVRVPHRRNALAYYRPRSERMHVRRGHPIG